jgi:hypothetical protein
LNDPVNLVDPSGRGPVAVFLKLLQIILGFTIVGDILVDVFLPGSQCIGGCPLNLGEDELIKQELSKQEIEEIQKDLDREIGSGLAIEHWRGARSRGVIVRK